MAFRGRVALITGAASGMGQLSAWRLADAGARVAALDVNEAGLERTCAGRANIRPYVVDVTNRPAVQQLAKDVEAELGPIDRVANAAAIAPTSLLVEMDPALIQRVTEINYLGLVNVTLATLPGMLARGSGDLIQYASLAGWLPTPYLGAYTATKFAVVAFSETLYHENKGRGVRMVCVCPPVVDTPLLNQVTIQPPPAFDTVPRLQPAVVIDAIEEGLERGDFFVFPGRGTRTVQRMRRLFPALVWRRIMRLAGS